MLTSHAIPSSMNWPLGLQHFSKASPKIIMIYLQQSALIFAPW